MNNHDGIVDAILAAYPDTLAIYLFGSWGTLYQRTDSDLDIAVLLPHDIAIDVDFKDWVTLNGELSYVSRTDYVDLVNLQTATTGIQAEIISTGDAVFCQDDDARVEFEAFVLSMHQDLNIQREPLYQDMRADSRATQP